jgi:hypothetical protein
MGSVSIDDWFVEPRRVANLSDNPIYAELDAKLVEVGVLIWNTAPQFSSERVKAFLATYGEVPVVVVVYMLEAELGAYIKVSELPSIREMIYIGHEYGKVVAKFKLLRR